MKKSFLILVATLGCNALAAQTSDPVVIPNPAPLPAQTTPNAPYQPSMGSNTLEVVTPTGTEIISPSGTETAPATESPSVNYNPPPEPQAPVTPNSNGNNPAGINNATPNLSLPQNPTQ